MRPSFLIRNNNGIGDNRFGQTQTQIAGEGDGLVTDPDQHQDHESFVAERPTTTKVATKVSSDFDSFSQNEGSTLNNGDSDGPDFVDVFLDEMERRKVALQQQGISELDNNDHEDGFEWVMGVMGIKYNVYKYIYVHNTYQGCCKSIFK